MVELKRQVALAVLLLLLVFSSNAFAKLLIVGASDGIIPNDGNVAFKDDSEDVVQIRVLVGFGSVSAESAASVKDSGWVNGNEYTMSFAGLDVGPYLYGVELKKSDGTVTTYKDLSTQVLYHMQPQEQFQMETGIAKVGTTWKSVSFTKSFSDPIVVAKSIEGCDNPTTAKNLCEYVTPRIRNITKTGFEIMLQKIGDKVFDGELNVPYIVAEKGRFKAGKFEIQAGRAHAPMLTGLGGVLAYLWYRHPVATILFKPKFSVPPFVISEISTFNGADNATVRNMPHDLDLYLIPLFSISLTWGDDLKDGFDAWIDEPGWFDWHSAEEIDYIAITPGVDWIDGKKVVVKNGIMVSDEVKAISFKFDNPPTLLADMQSTNGADWSIMRFTSLTNTGAKLMVAEKNGGSHLKEKVGFIAVGTGSADVLEACITADPLSGKPPLKVKFDASCSLNATTYSWDFGDGKTGTGATVEHTYDSKSSFTVVLTVSDGSGATDTAETTIVTAGCTSSADCLCGNGCYNGECLNSLITISKGSDVIAPFTGSKKDIATTWTISNVGSTKVVVKDFWVKGCEGYNCRIELVENGGKIITPSTSQMPVISCESAAATGPTPTPGATPTPSPTPTSSATPTPSATPAPSASPATHKITVAIAGNGHGYVGFAGNSGTNCCCSPGWCDVGACDRFACSDNVNSNTTMVIGAGNAPDSVFAGWLGGTCSGTSTGCQFIMGSDKTVTATFNLTGATPTPSGGTGIIRVGITAPPAPELPQENGITAFFADEFSLTGTSNQPNPFDNVSGTTTFAATGTGIAKIQVKIYDFSGHLVFDSGLVSGSTVQWNGKNSSGELLAYGNYTYALTAQNSDGSKTDAKDGTLQVSQSSSGNEGQPSQGGDSGTPPPETTTGLFVLEAGQSAKVIVRVMGVNPPAAKTELQIGLAAGYTDQAGLSGKVSEAYNKVKVLLANAGLGIFNVKLKLKEQTACIGWGDVYGVTGKSAVPRVLFNWSFTAGESEPVAIDQCDKKASGEFVYCDATQFMIELVKKLHKIDAAGGTGAAALTEFQAYLMPDGFSEDFRKDFGDYYKNSFFSTPSWFASSSSPWPAYITDFERLKFEPADLAEPGLYRVKLEFSFEKGDYKFFEGGIPAAKIVVKMEKVHGAGVETMDSPFYRLPFNGLVGTTRTDEDGKIERKGYGIGFVNQNEPLSIATVNNGLISTVAAKGKTVYLTSKKTSLEELNLSERGKVLVINPSNEIMFLPSYPMPVILGIQSVNSQAQAFYLPVGVKGILSMTSPALSYWTGIAASPYLACSDFQNNALPYGEGDSKSSEVVGLCKIQDSKDKAFGFKWASAVKNGERVFLKTIFYSAFADAMAIQPACMDQGESVSVIASPYGLAWQAGQSVSLQQAGTGVGDFKAVVEKISSEEICIAKDSAGNYSFFWNPEKIEKGLEGAKEQIQAKWAFNWANYICPKPA
ncbi:MAG: PKD domain-containing protein [Candidatus Diapherotrites archaeon]|nr:PKD domain-containing protein [Candidatus Diapherotrites archaeon]